MFNVCCESVITAVDKKFSAIHTVHGWGSCYFDGMKLICVHTILLVFLGLVKQLYIIQGNNRYQEDGLVII